MAKKIISMLLFLSLAVMSFFACGEDFDSETIKFYRNINNDSFYFKATVTENGNTYGYTQAVKNGIVTTINDREGTAHDGYVIFDGSQLHSLDFKQKRYDTEITTVGVKFIFANDDLSGYNYPSSAKDEELDGKTYRCETFRVVNSNGDTVGENKYYFTTDRLAAVVWIENEKVVRKMIIEEYSENVPEDIYFAPPEGFKPRTLTQKEEIPIEDVFGDFLSFPQ